MPRIPIPDPIDFLVRRKFPDANLLRYPPLPTLSRDAPGPSFEFNKARLRQLNDYKAGLRAKSPQELNSLYNEERAREFAEAKARAELEERERFFNQPYAMANFTHWAKAADWTLDEAIALSFGRSPGTVKWETVKDFVNVSPFARAYAQVRDLAIRALRWQETFDPVRPGIFIAWARQLELEFPEELEQLVAKRGEPIVGWKVAYENVKRQFDGSLAEHKVELQRLRAEIAELQGERDRLHVKLGARLANASVKRDLSTKERDSLLKLISGMSMGLYGFDPSAARNSSTQEIADDLAKAGLAMDVDTVRKYVHQACKLFPLVPPEK